MSVAALEVAWLGGLLEGEAYFSTRNGSPSIKVEMTDLDTLQRVARIVGSRVGPTSYKPRGKETYKPVWRVSLHGYTAIGWMMTLYQFMGARRREAIRVAISAWNAAPGFARKVRGPDGKVLPASCHPNRPLHARQMCQKCYEKAYMKVWRANRKAKLLLAQGRAA